MNKENIIKEIMKAKANPTKGRNSMGCCEDNYNPYFMVGSCFSEKKLENMDKKCLQNLIKLAEYASESFY